MPGVDRAPEGRADLGTIVAATDLTAVGNRAVELGGELAATGGGTLHVVHAWPLPVRLPVLPELEPPVETRLELQALESSARERLETALRSMHLPSSRARTSRAAPRPWSSARASRAWTRTCS
jgi:hypothetical protein